jgi:hypothetical protein
LAFKLHEKGKQMNLKTYLLASGVVLAASQAQAVTITTIQSGTTAQAADTLINSIVNAGSGITVVGGSANFVGSIGAGSSAQSGTYTAFNEAPSSGVGLPTLALPNGMFLTSGRADIPLSNTLSNFARSIGSAGDADLTAVLAARQLVAAAQVPTTTTRDANSLSFSFTRNNSAQNAISFQFVFGSEEFPDQGVTDAFAVIVDGTNFAFFPDGSLISFASGNSANFLANGNGSPGPYALEYDGLSRVLTLTALLNTSLSQHNIKFVIADTSDSIFDSGVFIGAIGATTATSSGGGIAPPPPPGPPPTTVSEPGALGLFALGAAALTGLRRRRK